MCNIYLYTHTHHILLSSHQGIGVQVVSASWLLCPYFSKGGSVDLSFDRWISFHLLIRAEVRLLGHMAVNFQSFAEPLHCFPLWLYSFTSPPVGCTCSLFFRLWVNLVNLHFSDHQWCWTFFMYLLIICIPCIEKCLLRSLVGSIVWCLGYWF